MKILLVLMLLLISSASPNVVSSASDGTVDSLLSDLHQIEGEWSATRMILDQHSTDNFLFATTKSYSAIISITDTPLQFIECMIDPDSGTETIEASRIGFDTSAGSWVYHDHVDDAYFRLGEPSRSPEFITFPFESHLDDNQLRLSIRWNPSLVDRYFELIIEELTSEGWWLPVWKTAYTRRQ
jgi:hypothetical protein